MTALPLAPINRELSAIAFNRRVMRMAIDPDVPLLERLRFLTIVASNLDELFEVRVASLRELIAQSRRPDQELTSALAAVIADAHLLVEEQYEIWHREIAPALVRENIVLVTHLEPDAPEVKWAAKVFEHEIEPLLTPIALDPSHPFPRLLNKSLNFVVNLEGKDAFGRICDIAIVQAPRSLARILRMPTAKGYRLVLLTAIVRRFMARLFPGMEVAAVNPFRLTRNSDLFVDEDEVADLRQSLRGELAQRHYGDEVRLEIAASTPVATQQFLIKQFELREEDCFVIRGPINLARLTDLIDLVDRPDLKYEAFKPRNALPFTGAELFEAIREQDRLLHHPYESFSPVLELVNAAAADPQVVAIRQTIYRTGSDSALMRALICAAQAGKEVVVVLELFARFDEEANIHWADRLERAGAHVVYGVFGHKTHAKMLLILRREGGRLRRYAHVGTGNYHARTARHYEDFGLFTAHRGLCRDVQEVFRRLTGAGAATPLRHLLQAPFTLFDGLIKLIKAEIRAARRGQKAYIAAKLNALLEPQIIQWLYQASQAGVKIDLVVRGVCALRPGVAGISDNIRVRSVVGRFLEHSRLFHFWSGGQQLTYISSADWMDRNFFRRVEIAVPIFDEALKARLLRESIEVHFHDQGGAWAMKDAQYRQIKSRAAVPFSAQRWLMANAGQTGARPRGRRSSHPS